MGIFPRGADANVTLNCCAFTNCVDATATLSICTVLAALKPVPFTLTAVPDAVTLWIETLPPTVIAPAASAGEYCTPWVSTHAVVPIFKVGEVVAPATALGKIGTLIVSTGKPGSLPTPPVSDVNSMSTVCPAIVAIPI